MIVNTGTEPEDAQLVARTRDGDLDAYRVLFERYQRRIYNTVYPLLGSTVEAEDVTQEAFVKAYQALGSLREGQAFLAWLYRIAINLARNHTRSRHGLWQSLDEPVTRGEDARERQYEDTSAIDPEAEAEGHEMQAVVRNALAQLSPAHREVIVLHHLQDVPVEEIARIVGCSEGTVKSRLARGREVLKRKLRGYVLAEM
ncbi:MAG TPA: sigma-70 family RNA polymerase sigma factor [Armatimonadota bacterium]|nr:sigma-70 family RNA polymerase sigma factor [Armatimonadota bacterium]